jgi:hypothetical protein
MAKQSDHLFRSWRWRLTSGCALVAYLITAIGVPVPAVTIQDLSQPFPCQGHACGCRNALECWQHCCCFTPREKLAWAEAHGVPVPAYAEAPATGGWHDDRLRDRDKCADCCCGCGSGTPCSVGPSGEVCSCLAVSRPATAQAAVKWARASWIMGYTALGCRGASTDWVSAGAVIPPPPVVNWTPLRPLVERFSDAGTTAESLRSSPPDPPPRFGSISIHSA